MSKLNKNKEKPIASHKEWVMLGILVLFAIMSGLFIYKFASQITIEDPTPINPDSKIYNNSNEIEVEENIKPKKEEKVAPKPFENQDELLKNISDDQYLTTIPYYYLIHKVISLSQEKIDAQVDPTIGWKNFVKIQSRNNIRGKFMKVRGEIVELKKQILTGTYAEARGLAGRAVWRGIIWNTDPRPYIFIITDFPAGIHRKDGVELTGAFYKAWRYQSQSGRKVYAPFIIGKTLKIIPYVEPQGPKWITIIFLLIFVLTCIFLGIAIISERREASKFWGKYMERKRKRFKKDLEKKDHNTDSVIQESEEKEKE